MLLVCRTLVVLCLLATITSTLRVYPHQLAYFNEAAGGPENGYKHLLHSNLDWGQDLLLLKEQIANERVILASSTCQVDYDSVVFGFQAPLAVLRMRNEPADHYFRRLPQGTHAISINLILGQLNLPQQSKRTDAMWRIRHSIEAFKEAPCLNFVGYTICLFEFSGRHDAVDRS